jgi:hypothetical protein
MNATAAIPPSTSAVAISNVTSRSALAVRAGAGCVRGDRAGSGTAEGTLCVIASSVKSVGLLGWPGCCRLRLSPAAKHASAFAFGGAAPHAIADVVRQRELEARVPDWTIGAHGLCF